MPHSQPEAFPLNSRACDLASWKPLVGNVCKLHTMGKLPWDPEPGQSPGPHARALMLCGRHLAMLNNFMSEFVLCKWSPMEHWSLQSALVCLPRPHDHPPRQLLGQLLSAHCTVGQASPSLPAPPWDHCHPYRKCPQQQTPNALQPFTPGGSLALEVGTARGHDLRPAPSWADRTTLCLVDNWEKGLLHMLIQVPSMFQSGGCNPWEDTCPHRLGCWAQGKGRLTSPPWLEPPVFILHWVWHITQWCWDLSYFNGYLWGVACIWPLALVSLLTTVRGRMAQGHHTSWCKDPERPAPWRLPG